MAKAKKNNKPVVPKVDPADVQNTSRDELMKTPGWSNVSQGSPQAKPVSSE
jgi:hypothetical protein